MQGLVMRCISHVFMLDKTQWDARIGLDSILAFYCILASCHKNLAENVIFPLVIYETEGLVLVSILWTGLNGDVWPEVILTCTRPEADWLFAGLCNIPDSACQLAEQITATTCTKVCGNIMQYPTHQIFMDYPDFFCFAISRASDFRSKIHRNS